MTTIGTLKNHAKEYLDSIQNQKKTRMQYGYMLTEFFKFISSKNYRNINMMRIEQFLSTNSSKNKKASPELFNLRLSAIRSYLHYLEKHEVINKNPARFIKSQRTKSNESTRTLTMHELEHILRHTTDEAQHAIFIMANTGLRISELASIRRNNIRREHIHNRISYILTINTKGNKTRRLELNQQTATLINKRFHKYKYLANTPLFPSIQKKGQCQKPETLYWKIKRSLRKIGFPNVTPHWLRHTFAQQLNNQKLNTTTIQQSLGHSNLNTTQRYLQKLAVVPTQIKLELNINIDEPKHHTALTDIKY